MKKSLFFAVAATMLASCASDELVDIRVPNAGSTHSDIRFTTNQKNITRSWTELQKAGHYNFGVFAYKSTDLVNPVMPNYLVGYYDVENGYGAVAGTTFGDPNGVEDGKSYWMYEGMGSAEYNGSYAGGALTPAYTSNNPNQYLKYWDNSADYTYFYAYAPYINGAGTATYVDGTAQAATGSDTYVLTIPNGTLKDGYDDESLSEYMYASAKVAKADYGHDVALQFQRLNAKVNIKFWEDIPGWKVRILDLSSSAKGVQAAASIKDGSSGDYGYTGGKYYTKNGVKIQFADGAYSSMKQFAGTIADNNTPLVFKSPTDAQIGENRYTASPSVTTYYAIPKGSDAAVLSNTTLDLNTTQAVDADLAKTGFTFHVSYELTAEDTGEHIVVNNATVHVPCDYCNWAANTHYTYIFKITKNTNGSTSDPTDPDSPAVDPTDPEVPTVQSLYPIVFDNCTVVDWDENESEWIITEGTTRAYHDVKLSTYSLASGNITVTVTDNDTHAGHAIDLANVSVSGPDMTNVTYDGAGTISVAAGAAAGVYTVTYTCNATAYTNHPKTWTEQFFVGHAYTINTHRDVIGTNSNNAEAKLNITGTMDGSATTLTSANLSIDYPANFTADQKAAVAISGTDVVVKNTATPGVYKVIYTIDEDSKVKVAEKIFTVVDYSLTLSHTVVFNNYVTTVVTGNQVADDNHKYSCTLASAVIDGNSIKVPSPTAEGNYTVTYTVYGGAADETVYTQTFEVRNTHTVSVSKNQVDRNQDTSSDGEYSKDYIAVITKVNGVNTTEDLSAQLSVVKKNAEGADVNTTDGDFKITHSSTSYYKLEVKNNVAPGKYYVKFISTVAGADKAEYAEFVVIE